MGPGSFLLKPTSRHLERQIPPAPFHDFHHTKKEISSRYVVYVESRMYGNSVVLRRKRRWRGFIACLNFRRWIPYAIAMLQKWSVRWFSWNKILGQLLQVKRYDLVTRPRGWNRRHFEALPRTPRIRMFQHFLTTLLKGIQWKGHHGLALLQYCVIQGADLVPDLCQSRVKTCSVLTSRFLKDKIAIQETEKYPFFPVIIRHFFQHSKGWKSLARFKSLQL